MNATELVKEKLKLQSAIIQKPQIDIYWLPRLIQVVKGSISIFPEIVVQKALPESTFGEPNNNITLFEEPKKE